MGRFVITVAAVAFMALFSMAAVANPEQWRSEGWKTDFSRSDVAFSEILSGSPPRDGIPSIDQPKYQPASEITEMGGREPVIRLTVGNEVRAYPLRILTWHEIANDVIDDVPVAVTYCPLCNAALVSTAASTGRFWTSAPQASCAIPTSSCMTGKPKAGGSSSPAGRLSASWPGKSSSWSPRASSPSMPSAPNSLMATCWCQKIRTSATMAAIPMPITTAHQRPSSTGVTCQRTRGGGAHGSGADHRQP